MIGTILQSRFSHYEACPKCRELGRDSRGDNLGVYTDGSKHCFSCGYHVHRKPHLHTFKPKLVPQGNKLPSDFSRHVPIKAFKWLLQYGLSYQYWKPHLGWSESSQRLVFTVGDPLQFSIGRYLGPDADKSKKKWYVYGESHKHVEVVGTGDPIVLVEDIISQHKVGQHTTALCLYGTKISDAMMYYLCNEKRPVVLWLDADQRDHVHQRAFNLQSIIGATVKTIITEKDPKAVPNEDIKQLLEMVK